MIPVSASGPRPTATCGRPRARCLGPPAGRSSCPLGPTEACVIRGCIGRGGGGGRTGGWRRCLPEPRGEARTPPAGWIIDRCAPTSPRDVSGVRGERTDCTQSRRPVPTSIRAARATLNGAPPRGCPCRRLELCNPAPRVPSPRRARSPTPAGLSPREAHRPPALSPVLVPCPAAPPPN